MKVRMSVGTHGSRDTSRWYLLHTYREGHRAASSTESSTEAVTESREIQDERGEPAAAAAAASIRVNREQLSQQHSSSSGSRVAEAE